jgi:Predicted metal-dependent hydrolase
MVSLLETRQITLDERTVELIIRRHPTAKMMRLRCDPRDLKVYLTLPKRTAVRKGLHFFAESRGWVQQHLPAAKIEILFQAGGFVPLLGEHYLIDHAPLAANSPNPGVELNRNKLVVTADKQDIHRTLINWLQEQAWHFFSTRSHEMAQSLNVTLRTIRIKKLRSRWGSCSAQGDLSYSWRLIMAPRFVADYMCAHEVSHRVEMNHSPRFWALVAQLCPDYKVARKWLRLEGKSLFQYNP